MATSSNVILLAAMGVLVTSGACRAHTSDYQFRTSEWSTFPGYSGSLKASAITGFLTFQGSNQERILGNLTVIGGKLNGLPSGSGAFAVYEGFDVDDKDTIGSPFYPRRCDNGLCKIYYDHEGRKSSSIITESPWKDQKWSGPTWEPSVTLNSLSWRMTLGRVVVLKDSEGKEAAVAQIIRKFTSLEYTYSATLTPYDDQDVRGYVEVFVPSGSSGKPVYGLYISVNADGLSTGYVNGKHSEEASKLSFEIYKDSCSKLKSGGGTLMLNKKGDSAGENPYGEAFVTALNYFYDSDMKRTSGVAEADFKLNGKGMTAKNAVGGSVLLTHVKSKTRVSCGEIVRNYVPIASSGYSTKASALSATLALLVVLLATLTL